MVVELLEEGSEVGWTTKADLGKSLSVSGKDVLNATWNLWVAWVSIDRKAVIDAVDPDVPRDSTKAEEWEALVIIIGFHDLTDLVDGLLVLVVCSKIVEGARRGRVAV